MAKEKCDVLIAGVGGQGIVLCSDILGTACVLAGIPAKGAEVHGMAQRGGSVEAHVRIGCVYGPRIPEGSADVLLAMEPLEGARFSHYLKDGGIAVVNTWKIPLPGEDYSMDEVMGILREKTSDITACDFTSESMKTGSIKTLNVLMLGAAAKFIPLSEKCIIEALKQNVKKELLQMNLAAFRRGLCLD